MYANVKNSDTEQLFSCVAFKDLDKSFLKDTLFTSNHN